ncbi:hypothetical protein CDAR_68481 [Caerostris darwini]|uniref:Uncharacterized protein n=1 Tax=Caerostris darwini TaxID=1538125 RepID=A0AAV4PL54_9ARAC|nr:hypothetical protein CDAR_68481 [Caerostris darwini]
MMVQRVIILMSLLRSRGFPSRKALKYHLFRLHGQPMRKPSQPLPAIPTSQDQVPTSPPTAVSISPSIRHDAKIALSFPINGNISCPETGCSASLSAENGPA